MIPVLRRTAPATYIATTAVEQQEFAAALKQSHGLAVRVTAWKGTAWDEIDVLGGSVDASLDGSTMRSASLELSPSAASLLGDRIEDLLPNVYATYVRIYRGLRTANGTEYLCLLGTFIVTDIKRSVPAKSVDLSLSDLNYIVEKARYAGPAAFKAGALKSSTVTSMLYGAKLAGALPTVGFPTGVPRSVNWVGGTPTNKHGRKNYIVERDRGQAIRDVLASIGRYGWFDVNGQFKSVLRTSYDGSVNAAGVTPVVTLEEGTTTAVVTQRTERQSRDGVYNAVVVTGKENSKGVKPVGIATLGNVTLDGVNMKWGGAFGTVPRFVNNPLAATKAACVATANTWLKKLAPNQDLTIETVPDPRLEPGDVFELLRKDGKKTRHRISSIGVSLSPSDTMSITCGAPNFGDTDIDPNPGNVT